jgi:transcriptional regulator with GAF, ATPase, and Fis domain
MLLTKLTVDNFGVFRGPHIFDLSTQHTEKEQKNINIEAHLKKIIPKKDLEKTTLQEYTEALLKKLSAELEIVMGLFFVVDTIANIYKAEGMYAYVSEEKPKDFHLGDGLTGQVAKNKKTLLINEIPEDYISVYSGLGKNKPNNIILVPVLYKNKTVGVLELAAFKPIDETKVEMLEQLCDAIGENITILAKREKEEYK